MATISSQDCTGISFRFSSAWPIPVKCPCDSVKPGISSFPSRSITLVAAPLYFWISALDPIAANRDRLRHRCALFHDHDLAVGEDQVGDGRHRRRLLLLRSRGGTSANRE